LFLLLLIIIIRLILIISICFPLSLFLIILILIIVLIIVFFRCFSSSYTYKYSSRNGFHCCVSSSFFLSLVVFALFFFLLDSSQFASPMFHLLNGSLIIGAFFIATDPVSAATTNRGRLIFGASIGAWIIIIRTWGNYPDAVAFAVVLLNMVVPLIDYYTRPRTYGHRVKASAIKPKKEG
jgi:hypothetical protein